MATSKLLKPTNVTISIPEFTDQPDQRVNSNCLDKEADAINSLSEHIGTLSNLTTSAKNNIVSAVNELNSEKQKSFIWEHVTGTTSSSGNIKLSNTLGQRPIMYCYNVTGGICLPYKGSNNTVLWCHVVSDDTSMTPRGNESVDIYFAYFA